MPPLRLARLQLHLVEVPLRVSFKHAAHERRSSLNIVCGLATADDVWGWGEALPREYVTGETAEEDFAEVARIAKSLEWPAAGTPEAFVSELERFSDSLLPRHPSARCAVEIALIDVAAKHFGVPAAAFVADLARRQGLPVREEGGAVTHSGVIGEGTLWKVTKSALKMRVYGLRQVKVKVGTDLDDDVTRLRRLRHILGRGTDLRVDANGAWDFPTAVAAIGALSTFQISSVEQPLAKGDETNLARLREAVSVPIALDESLTSLEDARRAGAEKWCDLFNIRLSKCGGIVSALRILAEGRRSGIGAWLGCMVGESGILSAAGRAFAATVDGLRHVEGSYDRHLLAEFLTVPAVGFGRGGVGQPLAGPGLGVEMRPDVLMRWTKQWDTFTLRP